MEEQIKEAIRILRDGGIVIFPTDTAFGVGCRIDNEKAVKRLFEIRKRPKTQAVPVLIDTVKMARAYVKEVPKNVLDKLIESYWPGALTIILNSKIENVPNIVRGGKSTLGVRIPNHKITRAIIQGLGVGVLGPSANFHGEKTPYNIEDLNPELVKKVDFVVLGECTVKKESTVIDCSVNPWKILRQGAIIIQNSKIKSPVRLASRACEDVVDRQNFNSKLKNKIVLLIDTSSSKEIKVGLRINEREDWIRQKTDFKKAEVLLPLISRITRNKKIELKELTEIEINLGPGSFTGLRVGVSVANALSFILKIPVNGHKIGKFVEPKYE